MSYDQDSHERNPEYETVTVTSYRTGQIVKGLSEHSSCKSEGEETEVAEYVTEDTGSHIVCIPQTRSDIDQRVSARSVEYVYTESGDAANRNHSPFHCLWRKDLADTQKRKYYASDDEQEPTPCGDVLL